MVEVFKAPLMYFVLEIKGCRVCAFLLAAVIWKNYSPFQGFYGVNVEEMVHIVHHMGDFVILKGRKGVMITKSQFED